MGREGEGRGDVPEAHPALVGVVGVVGVDIRRRRGVTLTGIDMASEVEVKCLLELSLKMIYIIT